MSEVRTPTPLESSFPWATVTLHTEAELREEDGVHFLSAEIEVGGEGPSDPWVTIETNYMTPCEDGPPDEVKELITFPCALLPQLRQMLESLEVRTAALSRVVEELEAPVRLARDTPPARRMMRAPRAS